jgi:hypothetical protein
MPLRLGPSYMRLLLKRRAIALATADRDGAVELAVYGCTDSCDIVVSHGVDVAAGNGDVAVENAALASAYGDTAIPSAHIDGTVGACSSTARASSLPTAVRGR